MGGDYTEPCILYPAVWSSALFNPYLLNGGLHTLVQPLLRRLRHPACPYVVVRQDQGRASAEKGVRQERQGALPVRCLPMRQDW